jgi:hypothetical protein
MPDEKRKGRSVTFRPTDSSSTTSVTSICSVDASVPSISGCCYHAVDISEQRGNCISRNSLNRSHTGWMPRKDLPSWAEEVDDYDSDEWVPLGGNGEDLQSENDERRVESHSSIHAAASFLELAAAATAVGSEDDFQSVCSSDSCDKENQELYTLLPAVDAAAQEGHQEIRPSNVVYCDFEDTDTLQYVEKETTSRAIGERGRQVTVESRQLCLASLICCMIAVFICGCILFHVYPHDDSSISLAANFTMMDRCQTATLHNPDYLPTATSSGATAVQKHDGDGATMEYTFPTKKRSATVEASLLNTDLSMELSLAPDNSTEFTKERVVPSASSKTAICYSNQSISSEHCSLSPFAENGVRRDAFSAFAVSDFGGRWESHDNKGLSLVRTTSKDPKGTWKEILAINLRLGAERKRRRDARFTTQRETVWKKRNLQSVLRVTGRAISDIYQRFGSEVERLSRPIHVPIWTSTLQRRREWRKIQRRVHLARLKDRRVAATRRRS